MRTLEPQESRETWIGRCPTRPHVLRWTAKQREQLEAWVRDGYPHETCGLLVGWTVESHTEVVRVLQARNLSDDRAHDRYELDPADWVRADARARADGLEIVGIWHSHPDHPARPSSTDFDGAWQGYSYLIARVAKDGLEDVRSWRLEGGRFVEEKIEDAREVA